MGKGADSGVQQAQERRGQQFPDYRDSVALRYVKRGYTKLCRHLPTFLFVPLIAFGMSKLYTMATSGYLESLWHSLEISLIIRLNSYDASGKVEAVYLLTFVLCFLGLTGLLVLRQWQPIYLMDFAVFKPDDELKVSYELFMKGTRTCQAFGEEQIAFQEKILFRSGVGPDTYLPPAIVEGTIKGCMPNITMKAAREEAELVMFSAVRQLLEQTGVKISQIGVLVVNCSLFNPTPSLAAMIMNHFKMHSNVVSYNLAGMGCSAGVIAIDLAKQTLQVVPDTYALVVSTENITQNWYHGNQKSMLIPNTIFRMGASATLLSNKRADWWRAKYRLLHVVRTTKAANDAAYQCVFQHEDPDGIVGVKLSRDLMSIAGLALKTNITTLGPLVLPWSEQLLFGLDLVLKKVFKKKGKPYIPDFKLAFDHFCIHTGGRAVIEEIEKQLSLTKKLVEPSKASLWRYGNVSSSSLWYTLAYIETYQGVKRGERVWQMGFGSGFKTNSAVWLALRANRTQHKAWEEWDREKALGAIDALTK